MIKGKDKQWKFANILLYMEKYIQVTENKAHIWSQGHRFRQLSPWEYRFLFLFLHKYYIEINILAIHLLDMGFVVDVQ